MSEKRFLLDCKVEQVFYKDVHDIPLQALRIKRRNRKWFEPTHQIKWRVVSDVELTILGCDDETVYRLKLPKGMITNLASRPWYTGLVIPRSHPGQNIAFVAHDLLYEKNRLTNSINGKKVQCSRFFADQLMRRALIDRGAPRWRTDVIYDAVRLFGEATWRKYRARDNAPPPA